MAPAFIAFTVMAMSPWPVMNIMGTSMLALASSV